MSKKKNTLQELNEFLKQQATSFVSPETLHEKIEKESQEQKKEALLPPTNFLGSLQNLATDKPAEFYDTLVKVGEKIPGSESAMLINTALYLKSGDNWKEVISEYWKNRT